MEAAWEVETSSLRCSGFQAVEEDREVQRKANLFSTPSRSLSRTSTRVKPPKSP
jgi:hypothetical protein